MLNWRRHWKEFRGVFFPKNRSYEQRAVRRRENLLSKMGCLCLDTVYVVTQSLLGLNGGGHLGCIEEFIKQVCIRDINPTWTENLTVIYSVVNCPVELRRAEEMWVCASIKEYLWRLCRASYLKTKK